MSLYQEDLGDGLLLRQARPEDAQALADFNKRIHGDNEEDGNMVSAWVLDLMDGTHPTFPPSDFTIVEDTRDGKIVSSLNLISQTWTYAGIPFKVGRPELVGTLPEYRRRGLVRKQFELIHRWSLERGELVQVITGIPYYYRLFGYEMTLALGGFTNGGQNDVPVLDGNKREPYQIRSAGEADLLFIQKLDKEGGKRSLINAQMTPELWRYELMGKRPGNVNRRVLCIIQTPAGAPVGFLAHPPSLWGETFAVNAYELKPGTSWAAVTPSVVRWMWATGMEWAAARNKTLKNFEFHLGEGHPVYRAFAEHLPVTRPPYAYYVRVPDLAAFLRVIAPVLEQRLAKSEWAGYSDDLRISFYNSGLSMSFKRGKIKEIRELAFNELDPIHGAFPGLTFLHMVFGHRTLQEIRYMFADAWITGSKAGLLQALFPRQTSYVWCIS